MSTSGQGITPPLPLKEEDRARLIERISKSPLFQRSPRLRELLLYLCRMERTGSVSEHQIGMEVFGRQPDYNCSIDTIARVQVSQLRKKLQEFFVTEGATEPVIIDFPKGSYAPVFRVREVTDRSTPALDRLWSTLFPAGHGVELVLADANLMIISDLMDGHIVSLAEYRARNYPENLLKTYIPDPKIRAAAAHISGTHLTPFQDAEAVREIIPLGIRYHFSTTVVHTRDFRMQAAPGNLIVLGHKKGNPWIELFEPQMNFRYDYIRRGHGFRGVLVNQSPRAGEEAAYVVEYEQHGYALLAYLPKPLGDGDALLVSGTDMSSIEAGTHFMTREKYAAKLLELLEVRPGEQIPYFEILLQTRLLVNTAPGFEIITYRLPKG